MRTEFYKGLSQDFSQLLEDADDYNVNIKVGENTDIQDFRAHSTILRARSPYFKRALSNQWTTTKKDGIISFTKPNISPTIFTLIIKYIYSGVLDLTKVPRSDIIGLLIASDELLLEELIKHIQDYFIEVETTWFKKNFITVLHTVNRLVSCEKLKEYCLESICRDPEPFFTSNNFLSLDKEILLDLIKRDDLIIEEVDIWEHLIKWGIHQISINEEIVPLDVKNFSEENFEELKETLDIFIPHVRFYAITSKDFFNKVRPYRKILPESLFEDVMSFFMTETEPKQTKLLARMGSFIDGSKILTKKHANIISNWIKKKDDYAAMSKEGRYHFTLLYRGTRDRFNAKSFHQIVNGKGQAIAIIKLKGSEKLIGGFNACGWNGGGNSSRWINNPDHFIFSFGSQNDYKTMKIGRFDGYYGVYDNGDTMLRFGSSDLLLSNGQNGSCSINDYGQCILDTKNFIAEELEVFKVTKASYDILIDFS